MLFKFLKYLQPTNYFSLNRNDRSSIFPSSEHIPDEIKKQLSRDSNFESTQAIEYDLSWQALQKGYISSSKTITNIEDVSVYDNYVFIRKYFHKAWVLYVFFLRVLSCYNPFVELKGFFTTRHVKRSTYLDEPIVYNAFENFESDVIRNNPKVSVIIPTLNRYQYLKDVLKDLEGQDYQNFDVYVVDQSEPFQNDFYKDFNLDLHLEFQEEKALWLARNNAIKRAKGDYILLYDDDSRVSHDWISQHLKVLDFFNADISSGVSISKVGAKIPKNYAFFRVSDQLDTGNVLLKREVFKTIGLFDRQFEKQRMGDGEYGLRAYLNGFLNISNPYAKRLHLKVNSGGLRTMGSWDAFRTKKWTSPRPIPSVLYLFRKYHGPKQAKLALLRTVPLSIMPYRFKRHKLLVVLGVLVSLLLLPLVCFQVFKSWRLSSQKLREGALIQTLS